MNLTELNSVPSIALPIELLKGHLKLGTSFSDDDIQDEMLETYLRAAISVVEARSGQILIQKQFSWQLTRWRNARRQVLPARPAISVASIKLVDAVGAEYVAGVLEYVFIPDGVSPAVEATGASLPVIPTGGIVEIIFDAGFGANWNDIPGDLAQAVMIVAAYMYENRSGTGDALPIAAISLIEPYRALRLLRWF